MENLTALTDNLIDVKQTRLMKIVKREPYLTLGSITEVFGRKMIFNVPKQYNNLSQIYIKSTITTTGLANAMPYLGNRIFEHIVVRNKRNTVQLANQTPISCQSRFDALDGTPLRIQLEKATTPDVVWNNNTMSVITPMFAWFSEPSKELQTKFIEDIEIECTVSRDYLAMGIDNVALTAASFEIYYKFYDDVVDAVYKPKTVMGYDVYSETPIANTGTNAKLFMTCPFPIIDSHLAVVSENQAFYEIQRVVLRSKGSELIEADRRMLYSFGSEREISVNDGGTMCLFYGQEHNRNKPSDYMTFVKSMYPVDMTVHYTQNSITACTLHVAHEYAQRFEFKPNGDIVKHLMNEYEAVKFSD